MSIRGFSIRVLVLTLCTLALAPSLTAQEPPGVDLPVREHTLSNGLRVYILPRSGAPTVSFVVQYPIGSVNEEPGASGTAHFLEHLFFKGTTSVGTENFSAEVPLFQEMDLLQDSILLEERAEHPDTARILELWARIIGLEDVASAFVTSNELDAILTTNGARNINATTTSEATTYFVELPANRAQLWFPLEADRILNPVFREFYSERAVVAEERRTRLETSPGGILYEAHLAAAFTEHPYGRPVIGSMDEIQRLTRSDVESFFRRYYGPNNAVLVIVGDVDPDRVLRWCRQYLEQIPSGDPIPTLEVEEPPQLQERRVEVVFDAEPMLRIGWKVPQVDHPDTPALDMLASILTGGRSSRLYRRLVVEDRLAATVVSITEPGLLYPRLFTIEAVPRAPHTTQEVEAVVYEELERLATEPPDLRELQRVRNQLEASEVRRLRSNFGLALQIASSASFYGDWRTTFRYTRRMQEVTPEDIQRVVGLYFNLDRRTVATLVKSTEDGGSAP
jgi:predicted Zn-dependent peptidase